MSGPGAACHATSSVLRPSRCGARTESGMRHQREIAGDARIEREARVRIVLRYRTRNVVVEEPF